MLSKPHFLSSLRGWMGAGLLSLTAACASFGGTDPYADPDPNLDGPAIWKLSDADSEIYLLGTFHVLPPEVTWQTAALTEIMAATPVTYFEADVTSPKALARLQELVGQYAVNPPGTTLSGILGPDRTAALATALDGFGIPVAAMEQYQPWFVVLTLTQLSLAANGFDPAKGADMLLIAMVTEEGDDIRYLESIERQIRALTALGDAAILENFDLLLDDLDQIGPQTKAAAQAWAEGDVGSLEKLIMDEVRAEAPGIFEAIFRQRNEEWTDSIEIMMAGDGKRLIAVGAGHLIGEDSVIDMLIAKGFTPVRVQ